ALIGAAVVVGSASISTDGGYYSAERIAKNVAINKGWNTIINSFRQYRSANIHREEIKELSESFVAEAAPMVVQVQGETLRLTGTAEAQYESWRKLLRDIYETETGFAEIIQVSDPSRGQLQPQPTG
ncbi:MAG: hypothetical protein ACKVJN_08205, partial [Woeseiales bacterium]